MPIKWYKIAEKKTALPLPFLKPWQMGTWKRSMATGPGDTDPKIGIKPSKISPKPYLVVHPTY